MTNTLERKEFMQHYLLNKGLTLQQQVDSFLAPPLYHRNYEKYFGTLYTAVYNLKKNSLTLVWPNKTEEISFDNFKEKKIQVKLDKNVSNHLLTNWQEELKNLAYVDDQNLMEELFQLVSLIRFFFL